MVATLLVVSYEDYTLVTTGFVAIPVPWICPRIISVIIQVIKR